MTQKHIPLLRSFDELNFNLGRKTLVDFLKGDLNSTIEKNNLDELNAYGCLFQLNIAEIFALIQDLEKHGFLEERVVGMGFKVIARTNSGLKEIYEKKHKSNTTPSGPNPKIKKIKTLFPETVITQNEKKAMSIFNFFLEKFNQEQKLAIISEDKNILCVAGAGSGKTTVLTKRIEFLNKFKGAKQSEFLAITFTKKAAQEMRERLEKLGCPNVKVETFNSFSEKLLKKYGEMLYGRQSRVLKYSDKIKIVRKISSKVGFHIEMYKSDYFTKKQIKEKTNDELFFLFVNDIFSIIDFYKNSEENIKDFYLREKGFTKASIAKKIYQICCGVEEELKNQGLRDFSDQIVDCLRLFREYPKTIPKYKYLLTDEFQDVNLVQVELLKILNVENNFAVGDPRQAIYGWRGSEIKYILDYPKEFKNARVIQLKNNYRSTKKIVDFFNKCISKMGLVDLETPRINTGEKEIYIMEQDTENNEKQFVVDLIRASKFPKNEIFVLARTNRILEQFAEKLKKSGIPYWIKSEDESKEEEIIGDKLTLATVHSIKGMEAEQVFIVGANTNSFPNRVADNFVFELVKEEQDYDKDSEELRLFYVAASRAKSKLIITYTGNLTKFVTDEMLEHCEFKQKNKKIFDFQINERLDKSNSSVLKNMIRDWRSNLANATGLPLYMIISNKSIDEIAEKKPQTKLELQNINGLGPMKIMKYGEEILKIIRG